MGRSHIKPIAQPDETSCGPAALKHALAVFNSHKSINVLTKITKTNRNGTTTKNMLKAVTQLGYSVLLVEYATLRHLQSALKYKANKPRAVLVSYLYSEGPDSGHWAMVSSFLSSKRRIVLLDSYTGKKKSYDWPDFRLRWKDYDLKRRKAQENDERLFTLVRKWQPQLLMIIAESLENLPRFTISTSKIFTP